MAESVPELEPKSLKEGKAKEGPGAELAALAKKSVMEALGKALGSTAIPKARLWNPWPSVYEEGLVPDSIRAEVGSLPVPETIGQDATFGSLTPVRRLNFQAKYRSLSGSQDFELTEDTFGVARDALKAAYLGWAAKSSWIGFKDGNCTYFAGVTIGFLAKNAKALVPGGAAVEQFNLNLSDGQGHAFVVVGRDPGSKPGSPGSWGAGCFIIDQWYARQRVSTPGALALKELADTGSGYYDAAYVGFLAAVGSRITRGPAFSYEELLKLG